MMLLFADESFLANNDLLLTTTVDYSKTFEKDKVILILLALPANLLSVSKADLIPSGYCAPNAPHGS